MAFKSVFLSTVAAMILLFATSAFAYDVKAGPIWNNDDAKAKCPATCQNYSGWNGNWKTTVEGQMSVCGCNEAPKSDNPKDKNAGPIWNNDDAPGKCKPACKWYGGWNGNWKTTVPGQMSVCGCNEP